MTSVQIMKCNLGSRNYQTLSAIFFLQIFHHPCLSLEGNHKDERTLVSVVVRGSVHLPPAEFLQGCR